ncbi:MAG: cold shock domain-containing protein [Planctomycetota bacterium]
MNSVSFISQGNGDEIYVHHSSIQCNGFKTLSMGDSLKNV